MWSRRLVDLSTAEQVPRSASSRRRNGRLDGLRHSTAKSAGAAVLADSGRSVESAPTYEGSSTIRVRSRLCRGLARLKRGGEAVTLDEAGGERGPAPMPSATREERARSRRGRAASAPIRRARFAHPTVRSSSFGESERIGSSCPGRTAASRQGRADVGGRSTVLPVLRAGSHTVIAARSATLRSLVSRYVGTSLSFVEEAVTRLEEAGTSLPAGRADGARGAGMLTVKERNETRRSLRSGRSPSRTSSLRATLAAARFRARTILSRRHGRPR